MSNINFFVKHPFEKKIDSCRITDAISLLGDVVTLRLENLIDYFCYCEKFFQKEKVKVTKFYQSNQEEIIYVMYEEAHPDNRRYFNFLFEHNARVIKVYGTAVFFRDVRYAIGKTYEDPFTLVREISASNLKYIQMFFADFKFYNWLYNVIFSFSLKDLHSYNADKKLFARIKQIEETHPDFEDTVLLNFKTIDRLYKNKPEILQESMKAYVIELLQTCGVRVRE